MAMCRLVCYGRAVTEINGNNSGINDCQERGHMNYGRSKDHF